MSKQRPGKKISNDHHHSLPAIQAGSEDKCDGVGSPRQRTRKLLWSATLTSRCDGVRTQLCSVSGNACFLAGLVACCVPEGTSVLTLMVLMTHPMQARYFSSWLLLFYSGFQKPKQFSGIMTRLYSLPSKKPSTFRLF